jgi:hypothetical protein
MKITINKPTEFEAIYLESEKQAKAAYQIADAMIKERNKTKEE